MSHTAASESFLWIFTTLTEIGTGLAAKDKAEKLKSQRMRLAILVYGQGDEKRRPNPGNTPGRNTPAMPFDNLPANRQPNPGTIVCRSTMQARKGLEKLVRLHRIETDSIILDGDLNPTSG